TQNALGRRLGRSQESVSETLSLLRLPAWIRQDYRTSDRLGRSLLLAIARQSTESSMQQLWQRAKAGKLTVRQARASLKRDVFPTPRSGSMDFRYPIRTSEAVVTVQFHRSRADLTDIVRALEEALNGEKARLPEGFVDVQTDGAEDLDV